ncbi:dehydratase [Phaeovulum sp. NW3]|nr:dehydratase [Phaeovulum sp. NW3]
MLDFAHRYDPQYFHSDQEAAKDSLFGELVASGLHTAALWRVMDHEVNGNIDWVCGVQWDEVRWRHAVRAGDTLVACSRVLSKRLSASRPRIGLANLEHWVENQHGTVVFSFISTALVYRRAV